MSNNKKFPRFNADLIENAPDEVEFNGIKYYKSSDGRYVRNGKSLSRVVWEYYNGPIPTDYEIHHIDRNPTNNDISNLACLSSKEHHQIHKELLTDGEREWCRRNVIEKAVPKAKDWHKSEEGRKWHSEHTRKNWKSGCYIKELVCSNCGAHYMGEPYKNDGNHFCSNKCKVAFRRKSGIDNEIRVCTICGKEFIINKRRGTQTCSKECRDRLISKTLQQNNNASKSKSNTKSLF